MHELKLAMVLCVALCLAGCGGSSSSGSSGGSGNSVSTITSVTATCIPNSVMSGVASTCTATVSGTGNYYSAVNWSASIGAITQSGVYTSPSVNVATQVTITATAAYDATKSGTTTITVNPDTITGIYVTCSPGSIATGQQSQCTAVVQGTAPEDQSVTWSATLDPVSNISCNCISSTGIIIGPQVSGLGQVTARATSVANPNASGSGSVYVYSPGTVTSVTPSCTKSTLNPGQDTLCTAAVTGTGGYSSAVQWSAGGIGTISPSGLYIASKSTTSYTETVIAWAVQDPSVRGTVTITVTPSATPANNVATLIVDGGPTGSGHVNVPFTTVTVCVPGTFNCQTIDHVLVDTGSVGLRLLSTGAAGGQLNLPLPPHINFMDHNPLYECAPFVSGFLWGAVVDADVFTLSDGTGEQASNIEIQSVGQQGEPAPPSTCSNSGVDLSNLHALGAKGILGIGVFSDDCGLWCSGYWGQNYIYYSCSSAGCSSASVPDGEQVVNPVSYFAADNQGSLISLPTPTSVTAQGSLVFGVNTQPNNQIGSAVRLYTDMSGGINTSYQGVSYSESFLDSGSNGIFFLNSQTLGSQVPTCSDKPGWYCPASAQSFSIVNQSGTDLMPSGPAPATFMIGNADQLLQNPANFAVPTLGGNWPLTPLVFDFGLPFFYGRPVFTLINGEHFVGSGGFAY